MNTLHILVSLFLPCFFLFSCSMSLDPYFAPSDQTDLQNQCLNDQRSALLQLQHDLHYAPNVTFSWDLNGDCCSWEGVTCDALGHVIGLDLSYRCLSGSFHSVFNLHNLKHLNLAGNNFNTTLFQYEFGKLPNLTHLNLSDSCFHGQIPMKISYLTRLVSLDLSNQDSCHLRNGQSDYYPSLKLEKPDFKSLIKNMRSLRKLYLDSVNISTENSKWCEITSLSLPKLKILSMSDCGLTGPICSSLSSPHYHSNLSLGGNPISYLPICNLSQLVLFNASYNKLSGSIPSCLGNISTLRSLDLQQNNFSGRIPDFAKATQLDTLQLNENKLEGKLPRSLANCRMLQVLNLGNNTLSDTFPLWLGKLPGLKVLILRANRFYGPIKHLKNNFPVLDVLDIASNSFSGELSIEFFQATHELRSLKIDGNRLEGRLPRSLANCKKLEVLDLGKNMIHDTFPFWLEKLPSLKVLVLRGNRFCGAIKVSGDENGFPMLRILDLASNNFSGELSVGFFQSLRGMKMMMTDGNKAKVDYIGDEYYQDSVTIVNKGYEIFYQKILTIFACLDLSNNSFHGKIPEEIQNLKSLIMLNLSYNSFFGPIPITLGSLTELESLDLSQNQLSGKIPPQLTSLTFLAVLNLSYNQLEGSIPQSYQFGTFSNDSYKGNPRLCGLPLTRKCNEVGPGRLPPKEEVDTWIDGLSSWKIVLIGYGCGLVIGLCIGYTVLNELGNKWFDSLTRNWNRKRRRSTRLHQI